MIKICSFYEVEKGFRVVSIALSEPKGVRIDDKVECLCPTWDMVRKFKAGSMSEKEYVDKYRKLIVKRWVEVKRWLDSLDNHVDICICCWERSGFCHRHLVARLLAKFRPDLEVSVNSEDSPDERPAQEGGSTMSTKHVKIYTDGACSGNPGPGGWAAILQWNSHERQVMGQELQTTNNRMELTAVIEGLKVLKGFCSVTVYTDSQYVIGVMNGWKRKLNLHLLADLDALCAEHHVTFQYVRGHAGHPLNERADELACMERDKTRSAAQLEDYDICDRCYNRITGDELGRAARRSDYITYCDDCNRRNNKGTTVAFPNKLVHLRPRRAIPVGL